MPEANAERLDGRGCAVKLKTRAGQNCPRNFGFLEKMILPWNFQAQKPRGSSLPPIADRLHLSDAIRSPRVVEANEADRNL